MRPLVRHGLRLPQRRDLGGRLVASRLLEEEDAVAQDLVIGLDLGRDPLMAAEVVFAIEDHRDQRELGLVHRHVAAIEGAGQV